MIWKPYLDRFEISNYGVVRNINTKKPYKIKIGTNGCCQVHYMLGKVHKALNVTQAVYHLFVDSEYNGRIYHKDKDKNNNRVENLIPAIQKERENWQIAEFEKWAYPSARYWYKKLNVKESLGVFIGEDYIQDSVLLMWKHLSKIREGTNFANWAYKYCRWAFLTLYKKERGQRNIISLPYFEDKIYGKTNKK